MARIADVASAERTSSAICAWLGRGSNDSYILDVRPPGSNAALISSADGARASVASSSTSGRGEAGAEERSLLRSAASENVASGSASVR